MPRVVVSCMLFALSLVALAFVYFGYLADGDLAKNKVLITVFLLFASIYV